jgi:O-antigen ligase
MTDVRRLGRADRLKDYAILVLILLSFWLIPSKALFNIPAALTAMLGLYLLFRDENLRSDRSYRHFLLAWLCLWLPMVMSLPDAVNFERSLSTVLAYVKFPLVGAGMIWAIRRRASLEPRVMLLVSAVFAAYSVDMLWQWHSGQDLLGYPTSWGRLTGPSSDDKMAIAMGVFVPLILESAIRFRRIRWLMLLAATVVAVAILLSGQRGAILTGMVGSGLWFSHYLIYRAGRGARVFAMVSVLLVIVTTPWLLDSARSIHVKFGQSLLVLEGDLASIDTALSRRVGLWLAGGYLFQQHPINGIGPRGFRFALEKKGEAFARTAIAGKEPLVATHPHLVLLEIAVECGVFGIVGYGILIWWVLRSLRPLEKRTEEVAWASCLVAACFPLNMSMAIYSTYWSHVVLLSFAFFFAVNRNVHGRAWDA